MSKLFVERLRRALDQRRQQIDAEAHIAGLHDRRVTCRAAITASIVGRQAGGADDMSDARLRGRAPPSRPIPPASRNPRSLGMHDSRERIVSDDDAALAGAGEHAGILAQRGEPSCSSAA